MLDYLIGWILGLITGLLPGLHPNTLAAVIAQTDLSNEGKALLIIGMASANIIASFILAIFFGVPDENTVLNILPGQRMTLAGKGLTAMRIVIFSAALTSILCILLFIPSLDLFPLIYENIKGYIKYIVLFLALFMIIRSKNPFYAFVVFLAAGCLGYYSFHADLNDPFLPLFSGMFAIASLLTITKSRIPKQKKEEMLELETVPWIICGIVLGFLAVMLPGISSAAQIASFASAFVFLETIPYLALITSISVSQVVFSFSTIATINKARVGTTAWAGQFVNIAQDPLFFALLFVFGVLAASFLLYLLRYKITKIAVLNSEKIAFLLIAYLFFICFLIDGLNGILIMGLSSILGWLTIRLDVERTQLMGAIIIPTLLLLFKIFL